MSPTRRTGILLALATAGVSGFSVFVNSYGVRSVADATVYTTAKNVVAALVLLVVAAVAHRAGGGLTRPVGRQWWGLAAVGILGGSIPFVLFFEGLARASSGQAAFLHKTLVLWVALLAVTLLGERLQWGHWLAIGLLLVGQAGLVGGVGGPLGSAEALILAATLLWAGEVALAKRLLRSVSSWTLGVARMGLGSVALLLWLAVKGDLGLLALDGEQVGWVLVTGLLLAAYVATWFAALTRAQAVDVTAVLVLAAPVTALLDATATGTAIGPDLGWLALVVAGGSLAAWLGWRGTRSPMPLGAG